MIWLRRIGLVMGLVLLSATPIHATRSTLRIAYLCEAGTRSAHPEEAMRVTQALDEQGQSQFYQMGWLGPIGDGLFWQAGWSSPTPQTIDRADPRFVIASTHVPEGVKNRTRFQRMTLEYRVGQAWRPVATPPQRRDWTGLILLMDWRTLKPLLAPGRAFRIVETDGKGQVQHIHAIDTKPLMTLEARLAPLRAQVAAKVRRFRTDCEGSGGKGRARGVATEPFPSAVIPDLIRDPAASSRRHI